MYVAVKGGEKAVKNSRKLLSKVRRGDTSVPEITKEQIENQLGLSVDRVMAEGSLYDREIAALAIKQAQGDLVEAAFLVRAFRTTLKRFGYSSPVNTEKMKIIRRVSGAYKDIPGGQILGPTYDYTHRLIEFEKDEDNEISFYEENFPDLNNSKFSWVLKILEKHGLMKPDNSKEESNNDLTREPLKIPAKRDLRLQNLARGDEGFLLASAYSLQRGFGLDKHPFLGELRVGVVDVYFTPPELGFEIMIGEIKITECFMLSRFNGSKDIEPGFENGYGLVFGHNERKAMAVSLLDKSLKSSEETGEDRFPAQNQEFILSHSDNVESSGFVQHLKLPHYVDFQSELVFIRNLKEAYTEKRKREVEEL